MATWPWGGGDDRPWHGRGALQIGPIASTIAGPPDDEQPDQRTELAAALGLPSYDRLPLIADRTPADQLRDPYLDPDIARTPLRLMRAEYRWCRSRTATS